jgi:hypothetical protein
VNDESPESIRQVRTPAEFRTAPSNGL